VAYWAASSGVICAAGACHHGGNLALRMRLRRYQACTARRVYRAPPRGQHGHSASAPPDGSGLWLAKAGVPSFLFGVFGALCDEENGRHASAHLFMAGGGSCGPSAFATRAAALGQTARRATLGGCINGKPIMAAEQRGMWHASSRRGRS